MGDILTALLAVVLGPLATFGFYILLNFLVNLFPTRVGNVLRPYVFIGPVLVLIGAMLVYPTLQTVMFAFMNADSSEWVGFQNFTKLFADPNFGSTLFNNVLWVAVVPAVTVILGIAIATLTDRLGAFRERVFKSIIFMPMAISFIAASSIWRLNYQWDAGDTQIGMLNAIVKAFGGTPISWMQTETFSLNSLLIMVVVIWSNAGFSMTLLSAAKGSARGDRRGGVDRWCKRLAVVLPRGASSDSSHRGFGVHYRSDFHHEDLRRHLGYDRWKLPHQRSGCGLLPGVLRIQQHG